MTEIDDKGKLEDRIKRRLSELYHFKNRSTSYQKRLLREGLKYASEHGLHIKLREVDDGYIDTEPLIELIKNKHPSLYRKYKTCKEN